jgi:hypothetical protein
MLLRNSWCIAARADEIGGEQPLMRRVCNEPIVVFRDSTGRAAALADRCCERRQVHTVVKNSLPPPTYVKAAGFTGRVDRWQEVRIRRSEQRAAMDRCSRRQYRGLCRCGG